MAGDATLGDTLQQARGEAVAPAISQLRVLFSRDPARRGHVVRLGRQPVTIGRARASDEDLDVRDDAMSRCHARIEPSASREAYLLVDAGSSNGTYLGGLPIEREVLRHGDIVRLGDTVLAFGEHDPAGVGWTAPADSPLVGASLALRRVLEDIERATSAEVAVLVLGETGTGKELVAESLHRASGRAGPLRVINCAAIPRELVESELFGHVRGAFSGAEQAREGIFRAADGGTLFLDEIGELDEALQAKLLRAIETRRVRPVGAVDEVAFDARIVAATNRDLAAAVEAGTFRADLYARLAGWEIAVPPLRQRPEDLAPLWEHFMRLRAPETEYRLTGPAFERLVLHRWPFNVRELAGTVQKVVLTRPDGGELGPNDLPISAVPPPPRFATALPPAGEEPTAGELRLLVRELGGNVKDVAAHTGKDRTQVYRWLKRYAIDPDAFRP